MAAPAILRQRLAQQRLSENPFQTPGEVVAWLGAVQAQDYAGAKWALGLRMRRDVATDAMIEQAFTAGTILRTHVLRPTWHFVTPADIRWLLELTAPRVNAVNASMYRRFELDEALFRRSNAVIANALQGGHSRTRAELGAALAEAGILAKGIRLNYILQRAELDAVVCSGPRRGKQFTYMLLEERAPEARRLPRDEALAELTRRYFTGHGPATIRDFAWWSGLAVAEAKAGLDLAATGLAHEVIDGQTYYVSPSKTAASKTAASMTASSVKATSMTAGSMPAARPAEAAFLLPTYDELLVGYAAFDKSRSGGQDLGEKVVFESRIVTGDRIAGSWRRTIKKNEVILEVAPFAPLTAAEEEAIAAAAQRYGDFVELPVQCMIVK